MSKATLAFALSLALPSRGAAHAQALGEPGYVRFTRAAGALPLASGGHAAPLLVSNTDWPGVTRAAGDLQNDLQHVTGTQPVLLHSLAEAAGTTPVLIGTIGKSPFIDALIRARKLDVATVAGHWEMALTTIVEHPFPGIQRCLVIAGADKRGTIYGIYDLSQQIGVSPWTWWADVRIPHHDTLAVLPGRYLQPEPAVRYRGIFLNDEAPALSGWAQEKFGTLNSRFYTHVFELLLRLKANYLWPAMWDNAFATDDPLNPKLADEYGIVMGTSHEEPMMRAEKEWKSGNNGRWDYASNQAAIDDFWRRGMERDRNDEEVVTLGMRGENDTPMSATASTALPERIVADQRTILRQTVNPDLTQVPQVWALYKEVQGYYEQGMRVPDDVTLLWSDDNWGNLRRLPTPEERKRSGGAGIYYHFDYVGGPRSYKWLNTYSITKIQEQMHLALSYGADRIWVVNVGDLKPMEFPIEFFLSYARTPGRWSPGDLHQYTVDWATREFGATHAEAIARCIEDDTRLNSLRKPEMLEPTTFSLTHYGEADRIAAQWTDLIARVDALEAQLPQEQKASFFELVKYPAEASGNVALMYIAAGRNALHARLGDPAANIDKAEVERRFALDAALSDQYNQQLLQGRWNHMMDQTHIGYTYWNQPPANAMPAVTAIQPSGHVLTHLPPVGQPDRPAPLVQAGGPPPPADFRGFVEHDSYISLKATDTVSPLGSPSPSTGSTALHWEPLPGYGSWQSALTVFPSAAPSDLHSAADLRYSLYVYDTGPLTLHLTLAPTLNFVPGRGLRLAVSVDDGPRRSVDILEHNTQADWATAVADGFRKVEVPVTLASPGEHILHVWAMDPGIVLEHLVLAHGPLEPSYLGPPDSPQVTRTLQP